ncbi:hypothetical protein CHUV0807_1721 [Cardiobacterium hominis]|uniref:Uncharacterized protein n=1 Tax=Cardiobacterium hominis TaxID=2718 RepID=A0A1C3H5C3_9GAMM|nr:hypothetical protein CHUV0807_1721 [Cardiobacterium hominis]
MKRRKRQTGGIPRAGMPKAMRSGKRTGSEPHGRRHPHSHFMQRLKRP